MTATQSTTVHVKLPWDRPPLSLNDRMPREQRAALTAKVRHAAGWIAKAARLGHHDHITVVLHYQPARRGRRDADNIVATLKPCADALVDAGVVDDDDPAHMTKHMPVIDDPGHRQRYGRLWLEITLTERVETPMSTTPDDCSGGDCLRVKVLPSGRRILWSSRRADQYIWVDADEWVDFVADIEDGVHDVADPRERPADTVLPTAIAVAAAAAVAPDELGPPGSPTSELAHRVMVATYVSTLAAVARDET